MMSSDKQTHKKFNKLIGEDTHRHNAYDSSESETLINAGVARTATTASNLEKGLNSNALTGGMAMTERETQTASTVGTVALFLLGLATVGMLIAILVMSAHMTDRDIAHPGEECHRFGLIDDKGTFNHDGECVGDSRGQCDAWIEFSPGPELCRPLTYGWTLDFYDLPNVTLCWHGLCMHALGAGLSHDWICPADGVSPINGRRYELKERGNKRCLDYVHEDCDVDALEAMATCIGGDPVCVYTYRDAGYTLLHGTQPPFLLNASNAGNVEAHRSMTDDLVDGYLAAKHEISAHVHERLGVYEEKPHPDAADTYDDAS